jgi:hypothetical protein
MIRTKGKVDEKFLHRVEALTHLSKKDLKVVIQNIPKNNPDGFPELYAIYLKSKEQGLYHNKGWMFKEISRLQCLVLIDHASAKQILSSTKPPGNVLHALERLIKEKAITEENGNRAIFQFVTGCDQSMATQYSQPQRSVIQMIELATQARDIEGKLAEIAMHAYFLLLAPEEVERCYKIHNISIKDSSKLFDAVEGQGLGNFCVATMRQCMPIHRDIIQDIIDKGCAATMEQAQKEYSVRELMDRHGVDRTDVTSEIEKAHGNMKQASEACSGLGKSARKRLETDAVVPTRDTRNSPDVTAKTRVIAVLGVDETNDQSNSANPSIGDGWMVSDFYLWMHVLNGMGKTQDWITTLAPDYLLDKYGREDKVTMVEIDGTMKPVQTKWALGFLHGDPFEDRKVVLNDDLLSQVSDKVTVAPRGPGFRTFFLKRLHEIMADAAQHDDKVLIMVFSHGDYESQGGLCLGIDSDTADIRSEEFLDNQLLKPCHISSILSEFPQVRTTMFMTSCYSGHWVETTEFQGNSLKPVILAAAEREEESFGFAWSHSQRHAGGLFSAATITELAQEPSSPPSDVDKDAAREYRHMISAVTAEMYRLCLPVNIANDYGSTPVFTDDKTQEKFWRRTGYDLHQYKTNFERLKTVPASDPHPKHNRKKFDASFVDDEHPDIVAWKERHPGIFDADYPEATAGYGSTNRGLFSNFSMEYLIRLYFNSNPRREAPEHRATAAAIRQFHDKRLTRDEMIRLRGSIRFKLQMNEAANQYTKALGLYKLNGIGNWDMAKTSSKYDHKLFTAVSGMIADSRLFHFYPDGRRSPFLYYRKPSQYLAASMLVAGYSKSDVEAGIAKIWDLRKTSKIMDPVTIDYMKSVLYSKSLETVRALLSKSLGKATGRGSLSSIEWH